MVTRPRQSAFVSGEERTQRELNGEQSGKVPLKPPANKVRHDSRDQQVNHRHATYSHKRRDCQGCEKITVVPNSEGPGESPSDRNDDHRDGDQKPGKSIVNTTTRR